jgi:serine/threonine protein phosphatase PrpC
VLPDPTVRQVALDARGARLILASDGVWDAVSAGGKGAAHRVRSMACTKAASNLRSFSKEQRDRDDITVIVADFAAQLDARVPQALAEPMRASAGGGAGGDNASSVASVMAEAKSMVLPVLVLECGNACL